jgi:hypothetical protein
MYFCLQSNLKGNLKMKNLIKAGVLAVIVSFGGANAFAADSGPTVSDAHELIGDLIGRGLLSPDGQIGGEHSIYSNYAGSGCTSNARYVRKDGSNETSLRIEWSAISSAVKHDGTVGIAESIFGAVSYTDAENGTRQINYGKFYTVDENTRKRLEKAFNLLIRSCNKGSKFD